MPKNQKTPKKKGLITIQVVEGKVEKIRISGGSRLEGYVRSRLKKAASPVLNQGRLIESLQQLQTNENVEKISGELIEGSKPGKTLLNVKIKTRQPFKVGAFIDNSRSPTVGTFQRGVTLRHNNLVGLGDSLSLEYRNTDGSNAYSVDYSVPINVRNGTIGLSYTKVSSNIVEQPFNEFDIIGDARGYKLSFRQPLVGTSRAGSTQEFALGLAFERLESESYLLGTPFPLSEGSNDRGRTRISALRFFQDWTSRGKSTVFQLRSRFSIGIGVLEPTINNIGPDNRFVAWQGQGLWLQRLGKTSLLLRGKLQLASRPLVALEQITLGGGSTVRGYRQGVHLSDNAVMLGSELRIPVWNEFEIIPFVDFGHSWNNNRENSDDRLVASELGNLLSVGLGLEYKLKDKFSARFDWGIPLIDDNTNNNSNTWQENGFYFGIRYQGF